MSKPQVPCVTPALVDTRTRGTLEINTVRSGYTGGRGFFRDEKGDRGSSNGYIPK